MGLFPPSGQQLRLIEVFTRKRGGRAELSGGRFDGEIVDLPSPPPTLLRRAIAQPVLLKPVAMTGISYEELIYEATGYTNQSGDRVYRLRK